MCTFHSVQHVKRVVLLPRRRAHNSHKSLEDKRKETKKKEIQPKSHNKRRNSKRKLINFVVVFFSSAANVNGSAFFSLAPQILRHNTLDYKFNRLCIISTLTSFATCVSFRLFRFLLSFDSVLATILAISAATWLCHLVCSHFVCVESN